MSDWAEQALPRDHPMCHRAPNDTKKKVPIMSEVNLSGQDEQRLCTTCTWSGLPHKHVAVRLESEEAMSGQDEQRRRFEEPAREYLREWSANYKKHGDLAIVDWSGSQLEYHLANFAARQAAQPTSEQQWKCKARSANMGANDPQECNWPMCGCDPYADKVIAALQEHGIIFAIPSKLEEIARKIMKRYEDNYDNSIAMEEFTGQVLQILTSDLLGEKA